MFACDLRAYAFWRHSNYAGQLELSRGLGEVRRWQMVRHSISQAKVKAGPGVSKWAMPGIGGFIHDQHVVGRHNSFAIVRATMRAWGQWSDSAQHAIPVADRGPMLARSPV